MTKMTWLDLDPSRMCLADLGARAHLPHEETVALIARAQAGDKEAFHEVVMTNGRLVIDIASRYECPVPLYDRCTEGVVGLMRAVEKFDPTAGCHFSTYATFWVRQAVQRAVANYDRRIRIPVHMADRSRRVRRTKAEMEAEKGHPPTNEELAEVLPLTPEQVDKALRTTVDAASLDELLGDDGWTVGATVPAGDDVEQDAATNLLGETLDGYLEKLSARRAKMVRMRFGLNGHEPMTLSEIGDRFGLTRERIRQLIQESLKQMRVWARRDFGEG